MEKISQSLNLNDYSEPSLINLLKNYQLFYWARPPLPFCRGCEKPIKTIRENKEFLGGIFTELTQQVIKEPIIKHQVVHQDKKVN
jgi:hypothetical protein